MKSVYPVLASLMLLIGLSSCLEFYHSKVADDDIQLSQKEVSYQMVSDNVIRARCVTCHSQDFGSYDLIRSNIQAIQFRALQKRDMPPNAPLSKAETKILQTWIDAGMPMNAGENAEPLPPLEPTYASIRDRIFTPHCAKCHAPGAKADKIKLFDRELLTAASGWVIPGDPANSKLFISLLKPDKGRMPPVKTGPGLSSEEIETIRTWIINGAQD